MPALAEPPRLAFSDGSIPPPFEDIGRDLLGMSLVLQEVAPYFTGTWQAHYETLDQHLEYLASLLGDVSDAGPEAEAALRRAIAYGRDLASFNLSVMLCERSPGAGSPLVKPNINNEHGTGALDLTWRGFRELRQDPFWVDHAPGEARRLHASAWRLKDSIVATIQNIATGSAGIQAAALVGAAWSAARLVAHGPDLLKEIGNLSGLSRLVTFLRGGISQGHGAGEAYWVLTATSAGGGPLALVVGTGAAAKTLALSEVEVWALVEARRLGQAAAMLHVALRELTPAQTARTQGLRGTNSVGGGGGRPPGFVSTQQWNTSANADRLCAALEKKLGRKLTSSETVHHIVPSTHHEAEAAREILDRFGIDINGTDNGVVLTQRQHLGRGLHTDQAIQEVYARLARIERRGTGARIIEELQKIANEIQDGAFPP
ncbi:MAG TPA: AHH domain-containing protein [Polyangia bacterium]|nr:AHH domain-containing protein [Polyangia bacterium]